MQTTPKTPKPPKTPEQRKAQAANAHEAVKQKAANAAIHDPVKLARAARIIRTALARKVITVEQLTDNETGDLR